MCYSNSEIKITPNDIKANQEQTMTPDLNPLRSMERFILQSILLIVRRNKKYIHILKNLPNKAMFTVIEQFSQQNETKEDVDIPSSTRPSSAALSIASVPQLATELHRTLQSE